MSKTTTHGSKTISKTSRPSSTQSRQTGTRTGSRTVFWVIAALLVIATAGAGGSYYLYRLLDVSKAQAEQSGTAFTTTRGELDKLRRTLADIRSLLPGMVSDQQTADQALQKDLDILNDGLRQMNTQLLAQQKKLAAIGSSEITAQQAWVQSEVIFLLRIANQRLDLMYDRDGAITALQTADHRLANLGAPAFTPVRAAIADEIRSLQEVNQADIGALVHQLDDLADSVDSLPLAEPAKMTPAESTEIETSSGWSFQRAISKIKQAFGGLVRVTRDAEEITPVLAPRESFFLRRNLELQFAMARLAAMQKDQEGFESRLAQASKWINRYFDMNSADVAEALTAIDAMKQARLAPPLPDISGALVLMMGAIDGPGDAL